MTYAMIMCVEWYDENDDRHIEWNVRDPEKLKQNLIDLGMDASRIDIYEKDIT